MTPRRLSSIALVAALALAGLAAAFAVAAQPYSPNPYDQAGYGWNDPSRGPDLAGLHDALHLAPDQDPAWRAFAAASTPSPDELARERAAQAMMAGLRSPQRVDLSISAAEADLQTLRERGSALKAFYAVLTPAQQAIFDRRTLPDEGQ
jgi:Spy/CpxP family protein refolding chaperone